MPSYNSSNTVSKTVESIIAQTYDNWELVFVDDCSTDDTLEIVESFCDNRIRVFTLDENSGSPVAPRNKGIKYAKGHYICFLDSDDLWDSNKLKVQLEFMNNFGVNAACSSYIRIKNEKILGVVTPPQIITHSMLLKSNYIGNLTGIYNCEVLGKFYQEYIGHEDYLMWLSILSKTDCVGVQEVLASYNVQEFSVSSNKFKAALWHFKILRNKLGLSYFKCLYYFLSYIFNALIKRLA